MDTILWVCFFSFFFFLLIHLYLALDHKMLLKLGIVRGRRFGLSAVQKPKDLSRLSHEVTVYMQPKISESSGNPSKTSGAVGLAAFAHL